MPLAAQKCLAYMEHALSGPMDTRISPLDIINDVGRWLYSAHPWKFRETGNTTLNLVLGQAYCSLPTDFGRLMLEAHGRTAGPAGTLTIVELPSILKMRINGPDTAGSSYFGAIQHLGSDLTIAPVPVLAIYPTPAANETGAFTIFYHRKFPAIALDSATIAVPEYCEMLFLELCRHVARGYEEDDGPSISMRLAEMVDSPEWAAAVSEDAGIQPDGGPLMCGMVHGALVWEPDYIYPEPGGPV